MTFDGIFIALALAGTTFTAILAFLAFQFHRLTGLPWWAIVTALALGFFIWMVCINRWARRLIWPHVSDDAEVAPAARSQGESGRAMSGGVTKMPA